MRTVNLSSAQQELYDAMKRGVICIFMKYSGANLGNYYFRTDNHKRCTATARALLDRGLVEIVNQDWRGHRLVVKKETQILVLSKKVGF